MRVCGCVLRFRYQWRLIVPVLSVYVRREWVCMRQRKGEREGEKATECVCVWVCWCRLQHRGTICVKIVRLFITRLCVCIHKESMCVCVYTLRLTHTNTLTCKQNEDTDTHGMHTSTTAQENSTGQSRPNELGNGKQTLLNHTETKQDNGGVSDSRTRKESRNQRQ